MKYKKLHMDVAKATAQMSYCKRKQVGATLVRDNRIIANAYNGGIKGHSNVCECNGKTKKEVVHAEINLISFCAKEGIKTDGCELFVTLSPCIECSKVIIQCGIKKVYYKEEYRDTKGIEFLRSFIEVEKLPRGDEKESFS